MRWGTWARTGAAIGIALSLAACGSGPTRTDLPTRPRNSPPIVLTQPPSRATQACYADLLQQSVRYSALPDRDYGGGCLLTGTLQLIDYGVPTTNLRAMACPLARTFVAWVRYGVVPSGREILGSPVVRVESMGTYACRNTVGTRTINRLSEHAVGNAVDVSAFVLEDGRRITIERDWRNPDPAVQDFLQTVRRSACKRFGTVLSPDYNAAHYNHLHLDLGRGGLCR
ncbi:extensin family protein [Sphingomonas donggukensis]|uniref:Extensin family protein n=1 Tax=Sphingomonas donggukensis TaxID=2949093 RepID=A0ABY4TU78_9SPHN|nr:extensin family protein [Sphingomonas donggukensis]URW74997.1 extensin family protein [Sphingomonas donggukensis]